MTSRYVLLLACALGTASTQSLADIIQYDAALGTLPTDQGFSYTGTIGPPMDTNGPLLMHGPTSITDVSAWQKEFPVGTMNFSTSTWSASINTRLTGSDFTTVSGSRRAGYHLFLSDDAGRWIIAELGSNSIGLRNDAVGTGDPFANIPLNVNFQTITVEAGPAGARLLVDGHHYLSLPLGAGQTLRNNFLWGDGTTGARVELAEVRTVSLLPAPGAAAILVAGGLAAARRRRR